MTEFYKEFLIKQHEYYFLLFMYAIALGVATYFISSNYLVSTIVFLGLLLFIFFIYKYSYRKIVIENKQDILNIKYIGASRFKEYNINLNEITCYEEKRIPSSLSITIGKIQFYKQDNSKISLSYNDTYIEARNNIVEIVNGYDNIEKHLSF